MAARSKAWSTSPRPTTRPTWAKPTKPRQIAASHGPSGANRDYLFALAQALRELGMMDSHVAAIERHLQAIAP